MKHQALFLQLPQILTWTVSASAEENRHVHVQTTVCEMGRACQQARLSIWDGETFTVNRAGEASVKIRVANIDAPEIKGRCAYESDLAQRSKNLLAKLLGAGTITLYPSKLDHYGRQLATIASNGRDIGDALVNEQVARRWDGARHPWCYAT